MAYSGKRHSNPYDFESHSHALQDAFALDCKRSFLPGRWLEIGANDPLKGGNNTALLELYGWTGISLELDPQFKPAWQRSWRNDAVLQIADATTFDYASIDDKHFDYIQLDVEPPSVTFKCLQRIIESGITAECLTFEHDLYANPSNAEYKEKAYNLLTKHGYRRAIEGVLRIDMPQVNFEDWYVREDHPFPTQDFAGWARQAFNKHCKPGRPLLV